jgi:pyrroloquinoline quinone biosynthesis protein D
MSADNVITTSDVIEIDPKYLLRYEESESAFVLLYPEGIVKLNSSAGEILKRCSGGRPVSAVIAELTELCPDEDLTPDVLAFLEIANDKGWTRRKA